jgi:hypothetical protein
MTTDKGATDKPQAAGATGGEAQGRITVHNVNVPGQATRLDAGMYEAMRQAILQVLPSMAPGLTQAEIREAVVPHLPPELFPGGAKAGWWAKTVQLDLEARGLLVREATRPLRCGVPLPLRWHLQPGS